MLRHPMSKDPSGVTINRAIRIPLIRSAIDSSFCPAFVTSSPLEMIGFRFFLADPSGDRNLLLISRWD
jgi:hypothetical protein